jgi:hypothetical protein
MSPKEICRKKDNSLAADYAQIQVVTCMVVKPTASAVPTKPMTKIATIEWRFRPSHSNPPYKTANRWTRSWESDSRGEEAMARTGGARGPVSFPEARSVNRG